MPVKTQGSAEPRWDDVRVFLAAYRHGTLGVAAGKLGLDVSTLSRRLAAFEAALDVRLFDRSRTGLVATQAAERLLPAAEAMEAALARLGRDASARERSVEGVVRIAVAPGMADAFVAPALPALRAQHPGLRIELDASVRPIDLTRHEAELALRSLRPQGAGLVITKLISAPWLAMTGAPLARSLGRLRAWDEAPWITWDRDLASFPPARWLARHVPHADVALRTSHFASQLVAASGGLGVALVPRIYARVHPLVPVRFASGLAPAADEWPTDDLWLVGHRALRDVPRVAAVWDFFVALLRGG